MNESYSTAVDSVDRLEKLSAQAAAHTEALYQCAREDAADPATREAKTAMFLRGLHMVQDWLHSENATGIDAQLFIIELVSQVVVDLTADEDEMDCPRELQAIAALMAMNKLLAAAVKLRVRAKEGEEL